MANEKPPDELSGLRLTDEAVPPEPGMPPRTVPPIASGARTRDIGRPAGVETYGSSVYGAAAYDSAVYGQRSGGPIDNVLNPGRPGPGPLPRSTSNATLNSAFDVVEPVKPAETALPPPPPYFGPEPELRVGGGISVKDKAGIVGVDVGGAAEGVIGPGEPKHYVLNAEHGDYHINPRPEPVPPVINATANTYLGESTLAATATISRRPKRKRTVVIRNKTQVIREAGVLIATLDDALGYRARDRGNSLPPELWRHLGLDDPESFALITKLVGELRKLNAFLESDRKNASNAKIVAELQKVGLKVLKTYGNTVAIGAGLLTIGALCSVLQHVGLGEIVDNTIVWKKIGH